MAQKKSTSKRSNGVEKQAAAQAEPKQTSPKPRIRKLSAVPAPAPAAYTLSDEEIAQKAYALWESRGRPHGSPEEDWHRAKEQLGLGSGPELR